MIDDPVLIEDWHPVARVEDLAGGGPVAARLLDEDLVLWRSGDEYLAWRDLCVHRGTRLSLGHVVSGDRLLSMLSIRDLMRVAIEERGAEIEYLKEYLYQVPPSGTR